MKAIRTKLIVGICTLGVAVLACAAEVAGTWNLSVESPNGTRESTLVLSQSGQEVTGTMKTQRGDAPVKGTLKGNELTFSYKVSMQGNDLEIKYTAAVEGNAMNGTVAFGGMGEGKFTGKKQ